MTPNTLNRFRPLMKFCIDRHFIYITAHVDESKEELQSYYKLIEEDLEEITKEWLVEFLICVDQVELSDLDLIESSVVNREEYDAPRSSRKKKKEYVQEILAHQNKLHYIHLVEEEMMKWTKKRKKGTKKSKSKVK
jgi:hypothetical protein